MKSFDFVLCVNDRYSQYIAVTIKSICENHRGQGISIHVLTDYISDFNKKTLQDIVNEYLGAQLRFYSVDDSRLKGLKDTWSIYTWYRVLIPELLPDVDRCLYIDADTVITNDLSALFELPMDDYAIGGVIDVENFNEETRERCGLTKNDRYVCAGIMLMNLQYWRKNDLAKSIIKWGRENDGIIKFPDQDTINILCKDCKIVLPIKYGVQHVFFGHDAFYSPEYLPQLKEALVAPSIIHYAGCAPWISEFSNMIFHNKWMKYNRMLKNKVRLEYHTKGIDGVKVRIWRLMHPYNRDNEIKALMEKLRVI